MNWVSIDDWGSLNGVHELRPDPYLIWANLNDRFGLLGSGGDSSINARERIVPLLVELKEGSLYEFRVAFKSLSEEGTLPKVYTRGRYVALWVPVSMLADLARSSGVTGRYIVRFDLCLPVVPEGGGPHGVHDRNPASRGDVLIGIIDNGCAFAHAQFRRGPATAPDSRLASIWDLRRRAMFSNTGLANVPDSMAYGLEIVRDDAHGLNEWLAECAAGSGSIDEVA